MLAQLAQRIHDRVGEEDGDGEGTGPILISDDCTVLRSFPPSYRRTTGLIEMIGHVTKFYYSGLQNFPGGEYVWNWAAPHGKLQAAGRRNLAYMIWELNE